MAGRSLGLSQRLPELRRRGRAASPLHRRALQSTAVALGLELSRTRAVRATTELGRRVHRQASARSAGRRGALRVRFGLKINNALRSALRNREGRRRKADVYSLGETAIEMPCDLVQFQRPQLSNFRGSLQTSCQTGSTFNRR